MIRLGRKGQTIKGITDSVFQNQIAVIRFMKEVNWEIAHIEDYNLIESYSFSEISFMLKRSINASLGIDLSGKTANIRVLASIDSCVKDIVNSYRFFKNANDDYQKYIGLEKSIEGAKKHKGISIGLGLSDGKLLEGSVMCKDGYIDISSKFFISS